jgi:hypothetical protein
LSAANRIELIVVLSSSLPPTRSPIVNEPVLGFVSR